MSGDHWIKASEHRSGDRDTVSLVTDITLSRRRERELNEVRKQAETTNRAKSAFLASMSHEIRTPMNGVVGMADLLCESALDDQQLLLAQTIRNSGEALLVIINDVLDFSKIEAGKLELYPAPFDLEQCIHEVVMLLQPAARAKNIELLIDYDMFLAANFIGDAGRIRQVLTNLVGNAIKFTESGHVLIRITGLTSHDDLQEVQISVEDSGIGISSDMIDHIFGEFNQVDEQVSRKFEGTGLGLAITKRLINLMSGDIRVDSTIAKGSCFSFCVELPVVGTEAVPTTDLNPAFSNALVVDCLEKSRLLLARQLTLFGLDVVTCANVEEADDSLDNPANSQIDIILTDRPMQKKEGRYQTHKSRDIGCVIPLFHLSTGTEPLQEAHDAQPFAGVLRKPILRKKLCECLQGQAIEPLPANPQQLQIATSTRINRPRLRILAAEDNETNQLVLSKILLNLNVELDLMSNGREAVLHYQKGSYDIVFMDISMPEMDGIQATALIRQYELDHRLDHVPVVALTAYAMAGDRERFQAAGLDYYLSKPLRKQAIAAKLAEI